MMYLGDHIVLVSKQTGLVEAKGKCIKITDDTVTLKHLGVIYVTLKQTITCFYAIVVKTNKGQTHDVSELLKQL